LLSAVLVAALTSISVASSNLPANAQETLSARGVAGQTLTVTLPQGGLTKIGTNKVVIKGTGYKKKVGIYVTFCVLPAVGKKPEHCGSYNPLGINSQAHWISSNPPLYAALLAKKFGKGGSFEVTLSISSSIGNYDCTKVRCAIVTRADHTRPKNRKADVFVPIKFN
jgi:hypothetical protein